MASHVPRAHGTFPSRPDENPKNHQVAAIIFEPEEETLAYVPPLAYIPPLPFPKDNMRKIVECSALVAHSPPPKLDDMGSFAIPTSFGDHKYKALCDLGAITSILPLTIWNKINPSVDLKEVNMKVIMADGSYVQPLGMVEDVSIQVEDFVIPVDFLVMNLDENAPVPIFLGRTFLATIGSIIDVKKGLLTSLLGVARLCSTMESV